MVAPRPERDATLTEDHRLRERDHAAGAEGVEGAGAAMARTDRAEPGDRASSAAWIASPATRSTFSRSIVKGYGDGQRQRASGTIGLLYDFPQMGTLSQGHAAARHRRGRGDRPARPRRRVRRTAVARPAVGQRSRGRRARSPSSTTRTSSRSSGRRSPTTRLIVAPLCDAARIPAINYSGGERTRSRMDVPLPGRLARRGAAGARGTDGRARIPARRGHLRPVARRPPLRRVLRGRARPPRARGHRHREHLRAHRGRDRTHRPAAPGRP